MFLPRVDIGCRVTEFKGVVQWVRLDKKRRWSDYFTLHFWKTHLNAGPLIWNSPRLSGWHVEELTSTLQNKGCDVTNKPKRSICLTIAVSSSLSLVCKCQRSKANTGRWKEPHCSIDHQQLTCAELANTLQATVWLLHAFAKLYGVIKYYSYLENRNINFIYTLFSSKI